MIYDPHTGKVDADYLISEVERLRAERDEALAALKTTTIALGNYREGRNAPAVICDISWALIDRIESASLAKHEAAGGTV